MGYAKIDNPCDFIVYKYPNILYLECKTVHGNTLNFKSDIRDNQWHKLLEYSTTYGVNAGILCWFVDWDITVYLPIDCLEIMKHCEGLKSFNIKKDLDRIPIIQLEGIKKRVFFEYNLEKFLEEISYE